MAEGKFFNVKTGMQDIISKKEVNSMDYKPLPIGIENFEDMITNGYYYIDKTLLIKELIDKKGKVNLFTRPRRFGKSLNISMLQYFFEKIECDSIEKDNTYLFDGLKIMSAGEKYTSEMGKYPIIKLTLKAADQSNYNSSFIKLKEELTREFSRHRYLLQSEKIEKENKELYENILLRKALKEEYSSSLKFLSECLQKHHNSKVIILIDEYDVPLEKAYFNGYYEEMIEFLRSLFNIGLKTNDSLHFAVMTGCLRVSKESIFTGFNNPKIISITSSAYGEYFGFTEEEVMDALTYYQFENRKEEAKEWYNGYVFGNVNVYNPWSIISYLDDLYSENIRYPKPYWSNTSSNSIIHELIAIANDATKEEVESLIRGESILKPIHEDIVYSEIKQNMNNLWNFLFFTGYLKKTGEKAEGEEIYYELKIPNSEVLYIYKRKIREWFEERIKTTDLSRMYTAILNIDTETFQDELSILLADTISYMDSEENFYHGFLLGSLALMKGFIVKSNRESGNGRYDIFVMSPSVRRCAIILEIKVADKFTDLEKKCDEALRQIEEKKYDYDLRQLGYSNILKYGVAFFRKDCMVKIEDRV